MAEQPNLLPSKIVNWFYAIDKQQSGPVNDDQLDALLRAGTINPSTLVWREGMTDWQPLSLARGNAPSNSATSGPSGQAATPDGMVTCVECRRSYPPEEVIRYGDQPVCAVCKPIFLQRLREGAAIPSTFIYASFGSRLAAKILDGIILWGVGLLTGLALQPFSQNWSLLQAQVIGTGINLVVSLIYTSGMHWKFGATLGKMAVKAKVVRPDGSPLTLGRAIGRSLAEYISSFTLLIGYLMAAFDDQRRSLHDRMADTRVISVDKTRQ